MRATIPEIDWDTNSITYQSPCPNESRNIYPIITPIASPLGIEYPRNAK